MSATWTFVLTDAGGNALAELSTASGRTIAYKRNSYAEVNFTISHMDDACSLLLGALNATGVPRLKAYRRGPNDRAGVLRFRGPLAALSETSEETSLLTATFRSPFSVLIGDGDKAGRFLTSQFPTIYNNTDAGSIAMALVDIANRDSPTGLATDPSLVVATTARNATYPVGQNIGSAIMNLSALLDGFDFYETFVETGTITRTTGLSVPSGLHFSGSGTWGSASGSYFWMVTAIVGVETGPSNEVTAFASTGFPGARLSWSAVAGATAYNVYRSTFSGGELSSPAFVATTGAGVLTYVDTGTATTPGAVPSLSAGPTWNAEAFLNVVPAMGHTDPTSRFEYGPQTLSNVLSMSRTTTPPLNTLFVTGGNGLTSIYSDDTSVAKYGKWWGHYDFPDVIDQATLDAKARALVRPNAVKTLTLVPELGLENCPKPFDDWNLGDTVPFFASRGALQENTTLRVNGFTVTVDDNGEESTSVDDPTQPSEDAILTASLTAEIDITS